MDQGRAEVVPTSSRGLSHIHLFVQMTIRRDTHEVVCALWLFVDLGLLAPYERAVWYSEDVILPIFVSCSNPGDPIGFADIWW